MGISVVPDTSSGGESYQKRMKKITAPEPYDTMGNRIYGETQFGGGPSHRASVIYPDIQSGGYGLSYDQLAKRLGYGDNAGVWLAQGGGMMGKGIAGRMGQYNTQMKGMTEPMDESADMGLRATLDKLKAWAESIRSPGRG